MEEDAAVVVSLHGGLRGWQVVPFWSLAYRCMRPGLWVCCLRHVVGV